MRTSPELVDTIMRAKGGLFDGRRLLRPKFGRTREELITESSVNSEMQTYKTGKDHLQRYRLYEEIDDIVRKLYSVTDEEYEFIKQSLSGDKYML